MHLRQTVTLSVLTAAYLTFEMAFNARLLDVVGGSATSGQIHHIEIFGRCLSGIAVALVVLQIMLSRRSNSGGASPGGFAILCCCAIAAVGTYFSIQTLVDTLVTRSTPSFRHASMNIVLVQRALVVGGVELDGLEGGKDLFASPEGKAFLALFPAMAVGVERLDEKIHDAKLELLTRQVEQRFGGVAGYYKSYTQAVLDTRKQWSSYSTIPGQGDMATETRKRQDKAWQDYVSDLGKRGWTPSSVPAGARAAVIKKVRGRVPVPANWDTGDEQGFREAVATQVKNRTGDGSVNIKGKRIPPGLDFQAFFTHAAIQGELRNRMKFAPGLVLQPVYATAADFTRIVFQPTVRELAKQELLHYDEPLPTFAYGGKNEERGLDAARAAIVPPVALFFSLMGALGHLSKLCYLLVKSTVLLVRKDGHKVKYLLLVALVVLSSIWAVLSVMDNQVTQSKLFQYMRGQVLNATSSEWYAYPLLNVLHVVAVGQGMLYPLNERIRTEVLKGITYGYEPPAN